VTGEATFLDDRVPRADELLVGFVGSPVACGTIAAIDLAPAETVDGVAGLFTATDIDGSNRFGIVEQDEPLLADERLLYWGQPVVVVAAQGRDALERARRAVHIEARAETPVLEIDQARQQGLYLGPARRIVRGDVRAALAAAPHRLHGTFRSGGQEHFYFETQAALAYPGEQRQLIIHSSTQNPTQIQTVAAEVLGLAQHQVVCVCQRMGGAFGGKETQAVTVAVMAALVAHKTGRSARLVCNRDDDMRVTGKRHPYQAEWEVGFDGEGRILALAVRYFANGGAARDLSTAVLERTLLHAENAYHIPNIDVQGRVCFTNLPPNTALRGFGGPQAICAVESIIQDIAHHLGRDALDVRTRNVYGVDTRNRTPYGQILTHNHLPEILSKLAATAQYEPRRADIERHNARSETHLRGIALTAVKFGIAFTTRFMNQASALVNVYTDGTVQVSTGGTEMGQGLLTKITQLVADVFRIDPAGVLVMPTSTEKNANTSPTAASASTDLNGAAAVRACRRIKARLTALAAAQLASPTQETAPSRGHIRYDRGSVYDDRAPNRKLTFGELARLAHRQRVNLGARGFYATPGIDFSWEIGQGKPFFYFTQGAAVAEVCVDRWTGQLRVPRVDLLIDIGRSINPGVDRGQITGGFVQGMGWVTGEALRYNATGELVSCSPSTYKIPAISDVPEQFHCALLDSDDNVRNIYRSKAVGEPPLMLAISVWAAVKHALASVAAGRRVDLRVPATGAEILRCLAELSAADDSQRPVPAPTGTE